MNNLDPWKIWAVTGVLAFVIMSSAAIHALPSEVGQSSAQGSILTPEQSAPNVTTEPSQSLDEFGAVVPYHSRTSFSIGAYSISRPFTNNLDGNIVVDVPETALGMYDAEDQAPGVDVTQQLLDSPAYDVASNDDQPSSYFESSRPVFLAYDRFAGLAPSDYPNVSWNYETAVDVFSSSDSYTVVSDSGEQIVLTGPTDAEGLVTNLVMQSTAVLTARSGAEPGNEAVPVILSKLAVNTAVYQDLAFSGELDDATVAAVTLDDMEEAREQEIQVQTIEQSRVQVSALQQSQIYYNLATARANLQDLGDEQD